MKSEMHLNRVKMQFQMHDSLYTCLHRKPGNYQVSTYIPYHASPE
jgi:hypothetical protein